MSLEGCDQAASNYSGEIIKCDEPVFQPRVLSSSGRDEEKTENKPFVLIGKCECFQMAKCFSSHLLFLNAL